VKATISQLDETTIPLLAALLPTVWDLEAEPDLARTLFEWRYLRRPSGDLALVAVDGDRCVGLIDSYLRPYLLDGRRILLRETADWFCLPEYRPLGFGLRLMRMMMRLPEPLINIGGTDATRSILPRLGWTQLSTARQMILPVNLRGLASHLLQCHRHPERAKYALAIPGFLPLRRPRRISSPATNARVDEWLPGQELELPVPQQDGLVELVDQANLEWICSAPQSLYRAVVLVFRVGGEPVGLSLSQLEPSAYGPEGRIVHLQMSRPSQAVAEWIISETARRLADSGAGLIRSRASTPGMVTALRRTGFIASGAEPVYWWAQGRTAPQNGIAVSYLRADDAMPLGAARRKRKLRS
jgi:hypothetical protein